MDHLPFGYFLERRDGLDLGIELGPVVVVGWSVGGRVVFGFVVDAVQVEKGVFVGASVLLTGLRDDVAAFVLVVDLVG